MTKLVCPGGDLTATAGEGVLRCTLPPHYISSTTADKANEIGYGEFHSNSPRSDNCHMGPLKSSVSGSPEGLSFHFSFISNTAEATNSQLVQRSSVEEERSCGQSWSSDGWPWSWRPSLMQLALQSHWSLKAFSLLHLLPQIRHKTLDFTEPEIWISSAPLWQPRNIPSPPLLRYDLSAAQGVDRTVLWW